MEGRAQAEALTDSASHYSSAQSGSIRRGRLDAYPQFSRSYLLEIRLGQWSGTDVESPNVDLGEPHENRKHCYGVGIGEPWAHNGDDGHRNEAAHNAHDDTAR